MLWYPVRKGCVMFPRYRYFLDPATFAPHCHDACECDICGVEKPCFDASGYGGEGEYRAFCPDCVAKGRLGEVGAFAREPDYHALRAQLKDLNPSLSEPLIDNKARSITRNFELRTPLFPAWQDWPWPAHCGDYCLFQALAGQGELNALSPKRKGKEMLQQFLHHSLVSTTDIDDLWEALKPGSIVGMDKSCDIWETMAYVFKCHHCGEIVILWDSRHSR